MFHVFWSLMAGNVYGRGFQFFLSEFSTLLHHSYELHTPREEWSGWKTAAALEKADTQPQHTAHARGLSLPLFLLSLWGFSCSHVGPQRHLATQNAGFCNCGVILFCHGSARRPLEFNSVTCGGKTLHFGREGDLEPLGTTVGQRQDPRRRQTKRGIFGG